MRKLIALIGMLIVVLTMASVPTKAQTATFEIPMGTQYTVKVFYEGRGGLDRLRSIDPVKESVYVLINETGEVKYFDIHIGQTPLTNVDVIMDNQFNDIPGYQRWVLNFDRRFPLASVTTTLLVPMNTEWDILDDD